MSFSMARVKSVSARSAVTAGVTFVVVAAPGVASHALGSAMRSGVLAKL